VSAIPSYTFPDRPDVTAAQIPSSARLAHMNPTSPLMVLVNVNGTEIGRIPGAPLMPRAGETMHLKGTWYRVESVAYEVPAIFIQAAIATLRPIWGEEREPRVTGRSA
jgi:hypothetical protein